ncbi:PREDICTED: mediator of RNA polymerase II transcription subunit 16-like [Branchiostoma belcheri]|uniref:Mediator of RNA polymerase II transcription subunit 16 n=1 Tax=Branchiostoma belcheri TaxID=7741 RepID=A0A6P4YW67_BRABE|nr:PREDICTED: mediator of RNA polymerase II transcription subunit 16-like [Branchiostoma belcheri]
MDVVYVSDWEKHDQVRSYVLPTPYVCSWSCRNILAFAGPVQGPWTDPSLVRPIHVVDPDRPWDVHSFSTQHGEDIVALEWDPSGTQLLSAERFGEVKLWSMKDYLVNDWHLVTSVDLDGEEIVTLQWLHVGGRLTLNNMNMNSTVFNEKITHQSYTPSLSEFGGKACNGWVAVTATGMVYITALSKEGTPTTVSECLGNVRSRVVVADAAFTVKGFVIIALSDGNSMSPVKFYKLKLSNANEKCTMHIEPLPSFFLRCAVDPNKKDKYTNVTHVKFEHREGVEQVVVVVSGTNSSTIEVWGLRNEPVTLHKIFQPAAPAGKQPMAVKWGSLTTIADRPLVTALAVPKLPVQSSNLIESKGYDTKFFNGSALAIAFQDGNIHLVQRLTLHTLAMFSLDSWQRGLEETVAKRQRLSLFRYLSCCELSGTCCGMMGVDPGGRLYVFRLTPSLTQNVDPSLPIRHVVSLLEYCMLSGWDCWDVLLVVAPGMVESVIDKLTDNYHQQNPALQQIHLTRFVAIKAALYRLTNNGGGKSADCYAKLLLNAISSSLKALLRPTQLGSQDRGPAEKLAVLCSKSTETDLDKVMINLETKEFVIEPATLQSLQQLIQWVGDFTLYLLSLLPTQQGMPNRVGSTLLRDAQFLQMLRELLVMVRIWGLIKSSCLPVFTATSDNLDSLQLLFKLLTKAWMCAKEERLSIDWDDSLVDECCLLPSRMLVPNLDSPPPAEGIMARPQSKQPILVQVGNAPSQTMPHMMSYPSSDPMWRSGGEHLSHDVVRRVHLGVSPAEDVKQCSRCSSTSLLKSFAKTSAQKAWDQRWARQCLCGGLWRKVTEDDD